MATKKNNDPKQFTGRGEKPTTTFERPERPTLTPFAGGPAPSKPAPAKKAVKK